MKQERYTIARGGAGSAARRLPPTGRPPRPPAERLFGSRRRAIGALRRHQCVRGEGRRERTQAETTGSVSTPRRRGDSVQPFTRIAFLGTPRKKKFPICNCCAEGGEREKWVHSYYGKFSGFVFLHCLRTSMVSVTMIAKIITIITSILEEIVLSICVDCFHARTGRSFQKDEAPISRPMSLKVDSTDCSTSCVLSGPASRRQDPRDCTASPRSEGAGWGRATQTQTDRFCIKILLLGVASIRK